MTRELDALGLGAALACAGFNAAGVLATSDYDAAVPRAWRSGSLLPGARAVIVLGCGGRDFGEAFERSPQAALEVDPIDGFTTRVVESAARGLRAAGLEARAIYYWEERDGSFADFVALARACGLGAPSRLGILIHPVYGPWISLRALLLTSADLSPTPPLAGAGPCRDCPAPCVGACPVGAPRPESFDVEACAGSALRRASCREHCDARRACVVGREHAYRRGIERRHREATHGILDSHSPDGR